MEETKIIECPLCKSKREVKRVETTVRGKASFYFTGGGLCQCQGAQEARRHSARLNGKLIKP